MDLSPALVAALPKVALHDHLDGGLRAATVLELSRELGLPVPGVDEAGPAATGEAVPGAGSDVDAVANWFHAAADSGSLPEYLSTFEHTVALMQTAPQLRRIAREFVEDMAADGVVYAETRWAPHQHTAGGLTLDEAVQAVQDGLDEGVAAAAQSGRRIVVGQLLCYLRHLEPSDDLVDIAIARRGTGVLGLDLAGPEAGFPASWFRAQFERAREHGVRVTIHAGEAEGPSSIADALDCGAERIGHGVRLLEDIDQDAAAADRDRAGGPARNRWTSHLPGIRPHRRARARRADLPGDVPQLEPADRRRRRLRVTPRRPLAPPGLRDRPQQRQPPDEPHPHLPGDAAGRADLRLEPDGPRAGLC